IAASRSKYLPPSENESGVMFSIPITAVRSPSAMDVRGILHVNRSRIKEKGRPYQTAPQQFDYSNRLSRRRLFVRRNARRRPNDAAFRWSRSRFFALRLDLRWAPLFERLTGNQHLDFG